MSVSTLMDEKMYLGASFLLSWMKNESNINLLSVIPTRVAVRAQRKRQSTTKGCENANQKALMFMEISLEEIPSREILLLANFAEVH